MEWMSSCVSASVLLLVASRVVGFCLLRSVSKFGVGGVVRRVWADTSPLTTCRRQGLSACCGIAFHLGHCQTSVWGSVLRGWCLRWCSRVLSACGSCVLCRPAWCSLSCHCRCAHWPQCCFVALRFALLRGVRGFAASLVFVVFRVMADMGAFLKEVADAYGFPTKRPEFFKGIVEALASRSFDAPVEMAKATLESMSQDRRDLSGAQEIFLGKSVRLCPSKGRPAGGADRRAEPTSE